jgi:hypothetical protein
MQKGPLLKSKVTHQPRRLLITTMPIEMKAPNSQKGAETNIFTFAQC